MEQRKGAPGDTLSTNCWTTTSNHQVAGKIHSIHLPWTTVENYPPSPASIRQGPAVARSHNLYQRQLVELDRSSDRRALEVRTSSNNDPVLMGYP